MTTMNNLKSGIAQRPGVKKSILAKFRAGVFGLALVGAGLISPPAASAAINCETAYRLAAAYRAYGNVWYALGNYQMASYYYSQSFGAVYEGCYS